MVIIQVLVAVALIGLILIQHGKGADAGAAFGSGASGTVFGSRGSANFLSRSTAWLATVFFAVSLALAYLVHGQRDTSGSVVDRVSAEAAKPADAIPSAPSTTDAPAAPAPSDAKKAPVVPE
ncbi:MAG: preprotein translocase subunit SecG [Solimonas sp.]